MYGSCKSLIIVSLLVFLQVACQADNSNKIPSQATEPIDLERAIYSTVIAELYPSDQAFLVLDKTDSYAVDQDRLSMLGEIDEEALADFIAKNKDQSPIDNDLHLHGEVMLTNLTELSHRFPNNEDPRYTFDLDWVALRSTHPTVAGIVEFSRVGFNATMDQALARITFFEVYGSCYENSMVLLKRVNSSWQVANVDTIKICS